MCVRLRQPRPCCRPFVHEGERIAATIKILEGPGFCGLSAAVLGARAKSRAAQAAKVGRCHDFVVEASAVGETPRVAGSGNPQRTRCVSGTALEGDRVTALAYLPSSANGKSSGSSWRRKMRSGLKNGDWLANPSAVDLFRYERTGIRERGGGDAGGIRIGAFNLRAPHHVHGMPLAAPISSCISVYR